MLPVKARVCLSVRDVLPDTPDTYSGCLYAGAGHPYAHPAHAAPTQALSLTKGTYVLRARVRAKYQGKVGCNIWAVPHDKAAQKVSATAKPGLLPDWVQGEGPLGGKALVSFVICSTTRAAVMVAVVQPTNFSLESSSPALIEVGQCSSFSVVLKPQSAEVLKSCPAAIKLQLKLITSAGTEKMLKVNFDVRCRKRGQSFLFTYPDFDGSVQHAAAVHPNPDAVHTCPQDGCPVLLNAHGTGISASDSADSFKFMKKGDSEYTFGAQHGWLLAPSRHGAHNWEGAPYDQKKGGVCARARVCVCVCVCVCECACAFDDHDPRGTLQAFAFVGVGGSAWLAMIHGCTELYDS